MADVGAKLRAAAKGGKITPRDAYAHYEAWAALNNVTNVLPYLVFGRRMSEAVATLGGKVGRNSRERFYDDVSLSTLGAGGVLLIGQRDEDAAE
jgi:hypothetical protein